MLEDDDQGLAACIGACQRCTPQRRPDSASLVSGLHRHRRKLEKLSVGVFELDPATTAAI